MDNKKILGFAIFVQVTLLMAVFDVHFTSPISSGVPIVTNFIPAPSRRVVVISVDGLRNDALLEDDPVTKRPIAPYLRGIMTNESTWGVSNCRLPTESRPGHVAMLAGFYEDPSAITKGWKENPVDFDSIFNRSFCSFSFGSPDIIGIFHKGLQHNCSFKYVYKDEQNFAGNTMELDNWVLQKLENFFKSKNHQQLYSQPKTLFFLHLLGQDTSGHTHKPNTQLYRQNLANVDRIVAKVAALFTNVFDDNQTAFVLTADHGMTDWGSHGAGDPTETLTPIVAWGSGINKNDRNANISQADITPLLAVLLGVSIPVNSVGVLPTIFLNMTEQRITEAVLLNAAQLASQYFAKRRDLETKSYFTTFKQFAKLNQSVFDERLKEIVEDIRVGRFSVARERSKNLIEISTEGTQFYHEFYKDALFYGIIFSYVNWIWCLICNAIGIEFNYDARDLKTSFIFIVLVTFLAYLEQLPFSYYPIAYLIVLLFMAIDPLIYKFFEIIKNNATSDRLLFCIGFLIGIEFFVFSFYYRWALSVSFLIIILWSVFNKNVTNKLKLNFFLTGIALISFSFLPVVGKQPQPVLILVSSIAIAAYFAENSQFGIFRTVLILLTGAHSFYIHKTFEIDQSINPALHLITWTLFLTTPVFFNKPDPNIMVRIENIFGQLVVPFLLLTISHEGFFLLVLFVHLLNWVKVEVNHSFGEPVVSNWLIDENYATWTDFRRAYIFLAYIYIAFFGLGNLATLNSFDPAWVRCFVTTFSPFLMTGLILLKVIIPFFAVTLALAGLTHVLQIKVFKIYVCIFIFANLMALNFWLLVTNQGSWLDIGISLSHYVIQQVAIVFLLILYSISQLVIGRQPVILHYS